VFGPLDGDPDNIGADVETQELDGRRWRSPEFLVLSSRTPLDPYNVDWKAWNDANVRTQFYHPSLHRAFFVLPAEIQIVLNAPPPNVTTSSIVADVAHPEGEGNYSPSTAALVYDFKIEARGCVGRAVDDAAETAELLLDMARLAHLTPIGNVSHQFSPQGVTALLLVSESHLSAHTWPELEYAALDVCSCKELTSDVLRKLEAAVRAAFSCREVVGELSHRGKGLLATHVKTNEQEQRDEL